MELVTNCHVIDFKKIILISNYFKSIPDTNNRAFWLFWSRWWRTLLSQRARNKTKRLVSLPWDVCIWKCSQLIFGFLGILWLHIWKSLLLVLLSHVIKLWVKLDWPHHPTPRTFLNSVGPTDSNWRQIVWRWFFFSFLWALHGPINYLMPRKFNQMNLGMCECCVRP